MTARRAIARLQALMTAIEGNFTDLGAAVRLFAKHSADAEDDVAQVRAARSPKMTRRSSQNGARAPLTLPRNALEQRALDVYPLHARKARVIPH